MASVFTALATGTTMAQTDSGKPNIYDTWVSHYNSGGSQEEAAGNTDYNAAIKLGSSLFKAGDYADAEISYHEATTANPSMPEGWIRLAQSMDRQGQTAQAFAIYRRAFNPPPNITFGSTCPQDIEGLARYGTLCEQAGQHEEAVKSYNKARDWADSVYLKPLDRTLDAKTASPVQVQTMLNIVRGFSIESDDCANDTHVRSPEALSAFQEAVKSMPNDALTQFYYAYGLRKNGRFKEAEKTLKNVEKLNPSEKLKTAAIESLQLVLDHKK